MQENGRFSNQSKAKKTAKDSIFRDLFENPKYLLQLYQVLHPEDRKVTEDQISSVTIQNVLLDQMYNDLGFVVKERLLLLVEAQSTWSKNIVIRVLLYLANTWKEYIQNKKLNIYGSGGMSLPKPELYVIYTGERKERPEWIFLSEEFFPGQECFVDVKVRMLYDGKEGDILNQYVTFTKIYNEQVKEYGRTKEAVLETIRICKNRKILKEYLESREKEVVDIMMTLFDQEYAVERYGDEKKAEGKAEGLAEGEAKGTMKAKQEMTYKLVDRRIPLETISEIVEISVEVIKKWLAERPVTVR
ncbi:MAG TPA: hypothetical protein IAC96_07570 [Candidatus Fimimorpha faecalis]|uniref:Rpn family recombination-promoting nuclease/putative transposase n=1 Tax=Candidatus Fimimorpha faecalis TaxID=2840824 RepID=A0A9D1EE96_9FIRM|nr:hypothetical protein [Candidatus Fimimorpha faecalis]